MTELRDLRVPGLGLAPTKPLDELYPRHYDPLIAEFLRSKRRPSRPFALLSRLRAATRLGQRADRGTRRVPATQRGRGAVFGHLAR